MKTIKCMIGLFLVVLLSGCSSMYVDSSHDSTADFSGYQTWDWLPGPPEETGDERIDDPKVRERIKTRLETQLTSQGFVKSDSPDFLVNYHAALNAELNQEMVDNYYEYSHYQVFYQHWASTYTDVYETGTLVIDILDTKSKKLVWRGWAQADINPQEGPVINGEKIRKAAEGILSKFPPE
jgi:hypothetical protein